MSPVRAGSTRDERRASDEKVGMTRPKANPRSQKLRVEEPQDERPHVQNRHMGHPARKVSGRGTTRQKTPRVRPTREARFERRDPSSARKMADSSRSASAASGQAGQALR